MRVEIKCLEIEKGSLIDNLNGLSNSVVENQNTLFEYVWCRSLTKTPISESSGVYSGNSSSNGLLKTGSEHLSREPLTQTLDVAKLQQDSEMHKFLQGLRRFGLY